MMFRILYFLFILLSTASFSQEISGIVLDKETNLPIENVAVYFDNTTKGVITNKQGYFSLAYREGIKTPLVISYLGYKKIVLTNYSSTVKYKFLLEESLDTLDEVVLVSSDGWTRVQKLHYFRTQFLGETENGKSCIITNEDDIKLQFVKAENKLVASARKPIIIINKNLGYEIHYQLQNFEIQFQKYIIERHKTGKSETRYQIKSVFYSGNSLYKNSADYITKKTTKQRNNAFYGSALHFMRALANNKLKAEGYKIISGNFPVKADKFIHTKALESDHTVTVEIAKRLGILYKREASFIVTNGKPFVVDVLGNHSPVSSVTFEGAIGKKRIGDTLPLDYFPED